MKDYLAIILLLTFTQATSQTPTWEWGRKANCSPTGNGEGWGDAVDALENVYITGYYQDTISFGNYTFNTTTTWIYTNEYLVKYDSSGNVVWAKTTRGTGAVRNDMSKNLAIDKAGNIYLTGYCLEGSVIFDSYVLDSATLYLFLTKYDSSGNVLWVRGGDTTAQSKSNGVITDASGNIYITGEFYSRSVTFGAITLFNADTSTYPSGEIFIAKYDSSGNVIWAKSVYGKGEDESNSITSDSLSNLYITGGFKSDTLIFDSDTLIKSGAPNEVFIAKYDSSGNVLWARSSTGSSNSVGFCVESKSISDIYVTGQFMSGAIHFGGFTLFSSSSIGNSFLVKYDSSGNVLWAKASNDSSGCESFSLVVDNNDDPYISGSVEKGSTVYFDTLHLSAVSKEVDPMFIVKYNSFGEVQWGRRLKSGGDDNNCIAVAASMCLYVTGDFYGGAFIFGKDTLTAIDSTQEVPFLAKLNIHFCSPAPPIITQNKDTISVPKNYLTYQWYQDSIPINGATNYFYIASVSGNYNVNLTDSNGCLIGVGIQITIAGVQSAIQNPTGVIFPNPFHDKLTATTQDNTASELLLYDLTGRNILMIKFTKSVTLNGEQLADGIYIYEVRNKNGTRSKGKIIKQ